MPKFSIIIPYRDRSIENTKRCLDSIQNQTIQDFEIIFSDYGSQPVYQEKVKKILFNIPQSNYVYHQTRGMFWNRSDALNLGSLKAQGTWLILCDVDMILPETFLEDIEPKLKQNRVLIFGCVYLDKNFEDYDNINPQNFQQIHQSAFEGGGYGNVVLHSQSLKDIGYFQSFFKVWGYEDLEFVDRAKKQGFDVLPLFWKDFPVFHQWHSTIPDFPKAWIAIGHHIFKNAEIFFKQLSINSASPSGYDIINRPTLQYYLKHHHKEIKGNFQFQYPKEYSFNLFIQKVLFLQENEFLVIHQEFSEIKKEGKSKLRTLMNGINFLFKKIKISYRITDIQTHHEELMTVKEIEAFLFYFLLFQGDKFDYFFKREKNKILFILSISEREKIK